MQFIPVLAVVLAASVAGAAEGLQGYYYADKECGNLVGTRVDVVPGFSKNSVNSPMVGLGSSNFSVMWTGALVAPSSGTYLFCTDSDDGIQVWIDRKLVIDNWTNHGVTRNSGSIALVAGKQYDVVVKYYQSTGSYSLDLRWTLPGSTGDVQIPSANLIAASCSGDAASAYPAQGEGWRGIFYKHDDYSGEFQQRLDQTIRYYWWNNPPIAGYDPLDWSIAWEGDLEAPYTDSFNIAASFAGSLQVFIDNKPVIDKGSSQWGGVTNGPVSLVAGKRYPILVRYSGQGRSAYLGLWWSCSTMAPQLIPGNRVYSRAVDSTPFAMSVVQSRVNPVWISGKIAAGVGDLKCTVDGVAVGVVRNGPNSWYVDAGTNSNGNSGLNLASSTQARVVEITAGGEKLMKTIAWEKTDIGNVYGIDPTVLRVGDCLLLEDSSIGIKKEIDTAYSSAKGFVSVLDVSASAKPFQFMSAGTYVVQSRIDGLLAGKMTVNVVSADLRLPIACEVGYQRNKDVVVSHPGLVVWTSPDSRLLQVGQGSVITGGRRLTLRPMEGGGRRLLVEGHLRDENGPMLVCGKIDQFSIRTFAQRRMNLEETYADGSMLGSTALAMLPGVQDIDVKLTAGVSGVSFENGLTSITFNTNDSFCRADWYQPLAIMMNYKVFRTVQAHAFCHGVTAYQSGVQVSF